MWFHNYDPLNNRLLSTAVAAIPLIVLLGSIAWLQMRIHLAALLGLGVAFVIACVGYHMPFHKAVGASVFGAGFGLFPIGWIILNVIFLHALTVKRGLFDVMRDSLGTIAPDSRIQLILIAFSFGAFIEGVAGFGTPVAITGAVLIQLGFSPLQASGLALIANTAPVAFGSVGIPLTTLAQVTGLDVFKLSAMVGRQLPFFSLIMPFWVVGAYAGWRGMLAVWPAALVAGLGFAVPQFLVSNLHGPWLVDTISGVCSIAALVGLLQVWRPKDGFAAKHKAVQSDAPAKPSYTGRAVFQAWLPWLILTLFILAWGFPELKKGLEKLAPVKVAVPGLHNQVQRVPPVVPEGTKPETAELNLSPLSATGTSILLGAIVAGLAMGFGPRVLLETYLETLWKVRFSLITVAAMLALGSVTRFSGADATLGLALAHTGWMYPFFGVLLGWLGVALTGSDTASNVLFGSLQTITAQQTGVSPILMAAANSSGGVMGKMVDAQSIVVASTATNSYGQEGSILRFVFWHSIILAVIMGVLVLLQAYVVPFSLMVVK